MGIPVLPGWDGCANTWVSVYEEDLSIIVRPPHQSQKGVAWHFAADAVCSVLGVPQESLRRMRGQGQEFLYVRVPCGGLPVGEAMPGPLPEWVPFVDVPTRGYEEDHASEEDTTDDEDEEEESEEEESEEDVATESDASSTSGEDSSE